ncbi:hypothetical protein [Laspinema olomoucense]|nr:MULTISPECIES: hypothetical protein [unclassified Laspinema]
MSYLIVVNNKWTTLALPFLAKLLVKAQVSLTMTQPGVQVDGETT